MFSTNQVPRWGVLHPVDMSWQDIWLVEETIDKYMRSLGTLGEICQLNCTLFCFL